MGRWPPAPWAGPCCTQSCERRSTWRERPRWESEGTTRRFRSLGTCFVSSFIHLLVCSHLFTVAGLTQQTERNPPQELETKGAWAEQKQISDNSEISLRKFVIIFWTQCVWVKWLDLAAMPMERRHGKRDSQVPPLELEFCDQYSIYEICNMQYASNSIFCQPLYKVVCRTPV